MTVDSGVHLMIMQDSSSTEESEPMHDDSYAAELAKLRERSRARIATARESQLLHVAVICCLPVVSFCTYPQ